jgi:hypothetical protein
MPAPCCANPFEAADLTVRTVEGQPSTMIVSTDSWIGGFLQGDPSADPMELFQSAVSQKDCAPEGKSQFQA